MKQIFTILLIILTICFFKPNSANAQINVNDSLALVDLYNSTNGPNWNDHTNWLTSAPVSTWYGILSVSDNRVKFIDLSANNVTGHLPSTLGNLTQLTIFSIVASGLTGSLPSSLGNLKHLQTLDLGYNELTGSIPASIGNLSNLTDLTLQHTKISGSLPSELGNLSNLTNVLLANNRLSGKIPSSLKNLSNLKNLFIGYNHFTFAGMGVIARTFPFAFYGKQADIPLNINGNTLSVSAGGNLIKNTYNWYKDGVLFVTKKGDSTLTVNSNGAYFVKITNSVSTALTLTSNTVNYTTAANAQINVNDSLALVDLYNSTNGINWNDHTNWLTSAPVSSWYGITISGYHVTEILLGGNGLNGKIPSSLGNITKLTNLQLSSCNLKGSIPSSLGNLTNLQYINFSFAHHISGSIPASFGNLTNLISLALQTNQLTGSIPVELGNLTNLTYLVFNDNRLTGIIPSSLGNLTQLQVLDLSFNELTGSIPVELNNLTKLQNLFLDANMFTFSGLEKVVRTFPFASYSFQAIIPLNITGNMLSVSAGGKLAHNTYNWYKDGMLYKTKVGDSTLTISKSGAYYADVTNSVATALTLHTDTVNYTADKNLIASQTLQVNITDKVSSISVYPNPAKTNATLSFNAVGKYNVTLSDVSGKILQRKTGIGINGENTVQLNVSKYAGGMYLITIIDKSNKKQMVTLTKE